MSAPKRIKLELDIHGNWCPNPLPDPETVDYDPEYVRADIADGLRAAVLEYIKLTDLVAIPMRAVPSKLALLEAINRSGERNQRQITLDSTHGKSIVATHQPEEKT